MSNLQAVVKTELIGKELAVMVQKVNGVICYAVIPNVLEEYSGLELDEAIRQIGDFVGKITGSTASFNVDSIKDAVNGIITLDNVRISLRQAYLFKRSVEKDENKNITEYAFNIAVIFEDGEPGKEKGSLFEVKELSFAVWSCDRQAILDTMDIVDLSDIDKAIENAARLAEKKKAVLQLSAAEKSKETDSGKESAAEESAEEASAAENPKAKEPAAEA